MSSIVQILGAAMGRLRTRILDVVGLFALLLARLTDGNINLPSPRGRYTTTPYSQASYGRREQLSGDELLGDQLLRRQVCAHVGAPLDFTARVMARVAAEPAIEDAPLIQLAAYEAPLRDSPLLHQAGTVLATVGVATLVVLGSSFVATLANPSIGLTLMSALTNGAVMALAALRLAGDAFTNVATNAGL
ncbi:MAG TPA: hypothetical protein VGP82_09970, partial [Ktedonobacterales bacterium]|nr:hypothetical protein [Ktedonobacterales bacterium]